MRQLSLHPCLSEGRPSSRRAARWPSLAAPRAGDVARHPVQRTGGADDIPGGFVGFLLRDAATMTSKLQAKRQH